MSDNNFLRAYSDKIKALQTNDSGSASDWDQLENRMNHLDKKRRKRYVFFFILVAIGFILGGIYLFELNSGATNQTNTFMPFAENNQNNKNKDIKSDTEPTYHIPSKDDKRVNDQSSTFTKNHQAGDETSINEVKYTLKSKVHRKQYRGKYTLPSQDKKVFEEKDIFTIQANNEIIGKSIYDNQIQNESFKLSDDIRDAQQLQDEKDISIMECITTTVDGLKSKSLQVIKKKNIVNMVSPQGFVTPKNKMKYFIKMDGGPFYTIYNQSNGMAGPLVFTSHEVNKNMGIQNSINLQLAPNDKWKFNIGINRSQFIHHGSHIASLTLMDGICLNPNSNEPKEYAFSYVVTNGRSSSTVNLRLSEENPGSPLDSTDVFTIEMGMHKKTVSWAVPITVEKKLFSVRDWSFFAKGGINVGFLSNSNETITHFNESCANLCYNHDFSPVVSSYKSKRIMTGIILGTSLEWQLSRKISLVFNPEMNINIKMSPGDHNSAKWGVNLGAMYQIQ